MMEQYWWNPHTDVIVCSNGIKTHILGERLDEHLRGKFRPVYVARYDPVLVRLKLRTANTTGTGVAVPYFPPLVKTPKEKSSEEEEVNSSENQKSCEEVNSSEKQKGSEKENTSADMNNTSLTRLRAKSKTQFKRTRTYETPRVGKKTSVVWHFFRALPPDEGSSRAMCMLCKVIFKNPGGSTTGMRGHLDRKHPGVVAKALQAQRFNEEVNAARVRAASIEAGTSLAAVASPPPPLPAEVGVVREVGETEIFEEEQEQEPDQDEHILPGPPPEIYSEGERESEDVVKSIVHYLASNLLPLRSVEDITFKKLMFNLNGMHTNGVFVAEDWNVYVPLTKSLDNLYQEAINSMIQQLQGKTISLSLEIWVKSGSEVYLMITANFVAENWTLATKFLGIRLLDSVTILSSVTVFQASMFSLLIDLLQEFGIQPENLAAIVMNTQPFIYNMTFFGRPAWHCINSALSKSYDLLNESVKGVTGQNILSACREIVRHNLPHFDEIQRHPGLLVSAVKPFTTSATVSSELIDAYEEVQEPLNELVDGLLDDETFLPASNLLPIICSLKTSYHPLTEETPDMSLLWSITQKSAMIKPMIKFIESCYNVQLTANDLHDSTLALCALLDPRYKQLSFLSEEQRQQIHDEAVGLLIKAEKGSLCPSVSSRSDLSQDAVSPSPSSSSSYEGKGTHSKLLTFLSSFLGRKITTKPSTAIQEELKNYMAEPMACLTLDPYEWWRNNCDRYPKISALAKKYLCIVGTVAPAKHTFLDGNEIFYNKLRCIETDFMEKLLVLKRYKLSPIFENNDTPTFSNQESMGIKIESVQESVDDT